MAYRLRHGESLRQGIRRIAREQIAGACGELAADAPDAEAVHDARKRMKKLRALLRLVRPSLGSLYRSENARFRDIARQLSDVRDADVLIETFERLAASADTRLSESGVKNFRAHLHQQREQIRAGGGGLTSSLPRVRESLSEALVQLKDWPLQPAGFALVAPGLKRGYRRVRRCYRQTLSEPSESRFHEWRKQVKYHLYQLRILQPCGSDALDDRIDRLQKLSDAVGAEHDLALLRQSLEAATGRQLRQQDCAEILEALTARQQARREAAWALGSQLHAESPKALVGWLEDAWLAWHD